MARVTDGLTEMLESAVTALGYELVGVEYLSQGRHSVLRIYIDSENGITLDDCERVSHQVSGVLEVEDPIRGQYNLEVSSPGLDRPLFNLSHFDRFKGHKVQIKLRRPLDGRRKFNGVIETVENEQVVIRENESEATALTMDDIEKANLVPEI